MAAGGAGPDTMEGAAVKEPDDGTVVIGVAIAVPEPHGSELTRWREEFGDSQAANIPPHITLLPPTELPRHELDGVREHLETVAAGERAFDIRLRGTGTFRPVSPVVFVQVAEGIAECERVERSVRSGVLARELSFYYHPHVTVAHHLPDAGLDLAFETLADYQVTFRVSAFELYEHGADGVWRPAQRFEFDGAGVVAGTGAADTGRPRT